MILDMYKGCFERVYVFSASINVDHTWLPVKEYLDNKLDLNQAIELINIKTRQYAKRQVTWARSHMSDWDKQNSNSFSSLFKKILKVIS